MKRMRVLFGLISEQAHADGSSTLSRKLIDALRPHVDLSVVMMPSFLKGKYHAYTDTDGSQAQEFTWDGLPAIIVRPRTSLCYDLSDKARITPEVIETRFLSQRIADFADRQKIDLFHITSWHYVKSVIFEAAVRSCRPFVFTPYDCLAVCPQVFLRHHNKRFCNGPDNSGRKCLLCTHITDGIHRFQVSGFRARTIVAFSGLGTLLGAEYLPQWELVVRRKAIKEYFAMASRILPLSVQWRAELNKHLALPEEKYTVCKCGFLGAYNKLLEKKHLSYPLHIGYLHRISRESGAFFILEAWRRARLTSSQAVLHMFGAPGEKRSVENSNYGYLLKSGSVNVHEGRIADKMDEVLSGISAVVVGYQMKFLGFSGGAYEAIARGIPVIAPEWKCDIPGSDDATVEGLNAIKYRNFNVDSLAMVLRKCCSDPSILEKLYATCALPSEFKGDALIQKYLQVYEEILGSNSQI